MGNRIILIIFFLVFFGILLNPNYGSAKTYDWVRMGSDDIKVIVDPRVETQLRVQLIRQARISIDLATYDIRGDEEIGTPTLDALEEAAIRGIRVRLILNRFILFFKDPKGNLLRRLAHIASESRNFQFIIVGSSPLVHHGWKRIDGNHEKLLVADGRFAMTSGRGHADQYLDWLDTGFAFKGPLVTQSIEAFENLWDTLLEDYHPNEIPSEYSQISIGPGDEKDYSIPKNSLIIHLNAQEIHLLNSLTTWFNCPPSSGNEYKARVLHHDFFRQMKNLPAIQTGNAIPSDYSLEQRLNLIKDPIVQEVIDQLNSLKNIRITSLAFIPIPILNQAFQQRLKCSNQNKSIFSMEVFTNSKSSIESISPFHSSTGWYAQLPYIDELLRFSNVDFYQLKDKVSPKDPIYIHRKLIILNRDPIRNSNRESSVIFGSHNLTFASTTSLDELSFQIESNQFASQINILFEDSIKNHGEFLDRNQTHKDLEAHRLFTWFDQLFIFAF